MKNSHLPETLPTIHRISNGCKVVITRMLSNTNTKVIKSLSRAAKIND